MSRDLNVRYLNVRNLNGRTQLSCSAKFLMTLFSPVISKTCNLPQILVGRKQGPSPTSTFGGDRPLLSLQSLCPWLPHNCAWLDPFAFLFVLPFHVISTAFHLKHCLCDRLYPSLVCLVLWFRLSVCWLFACSRLTFCVFQSVRMIVCLFVRVPVCLRVSVYASQCRSVLL